MNGNAGPGKLFYNSCAPSNEYEKEYDSDTYEEAENYEELGPGVHVIYGARYKSMTRHLNCIVVFNPDKDKILFCKRKKDPYQGLYNFVGGKVEAGEFSETAAYRELKEEAGIGKDDICLSRLMDLTYYVQDFVLEIYVGKLNRDVELREEINPLYWLPLTEDFSDFTRFAGNGNILHIVNVALKYLL